MTGRLRSALALSLPLAGLLLQCTGKREEPVGGGPAFTPPALLEVDLIRRATALSDSAYQLLEKSSPQEAILLLQQADSLIPSTGWGAYNLACGRSRSGDGAAALRELTRAVDDGWDDASRIDSDQDLAALRQDPEFPKILQKARENRAGHLQVLAQGWPSLRTDLAFPDADSLDHWWRGQQRRQAYNGEIMSGWQQVLSELSLEEQHLAAIRALTPPDSALDVGRLKVRALAGLMEANEEWGPLSYGVIKEVQACLQGEPKPEAMGELCYRAGIAAFCRTNPKPGDPGWAEAVRQAQEWFAQVPLGTKYAGGAAAWRMRFILAASAEKKPDLNTELRNFAKVYRGNPYAEGVVDMFFYPELIHALWPIPLAGTDLQGNPVSLEQYKGKVLLVDFWATWCGPCRGELPNLRAAYQKYHPEGLEVLSVSLDYGESTTPEDYRRWIRKNEMPWRHIYDQKDWNTPLAKAFLVGSIPSPFLIGPDGSLEAMGEECRGTKLAGTLEKILHKGAAASSG